MKNKIAIIGLGYVGLPLALAFSKKFNVIGIDSNKKKVDKYKIKYKTSNIVFANPFYNLSNCNIFIVAATILSNIVVPSTSQNKKVSIKRNQADLIIKLPITSTPCLP